MAKYTTGTIVDYDQRSGQASVRLAEGGLEKVSIAAMYGPSFWGLHKGHDPRGIRVRVQLVGDGSSRISAVSEIEASKVA